MAVTGRIPTLIELERSRERAEPFVGRGEELAALRRPWPPVTLVFGEPGGGKTRLLAEAARLARTSVINVSCHQSATTIPLEPLLTVIRELRGARPKLLDWERPAEAGRLVAIRDQLAKEAASGLVIQLDDVQWADDQTLDAIAYLADRLRDTPLRWHVASRSGDDRSERLALRLAKMRLGDVVRLREFGMPDFRAFVAAACEQPPAEATIAELYSLSGGNPLYAEQLIVAAVAGESTQPAGLNALLSERIQSLTAVQLVVARAIAISAEAVSIEVLGELSQLRADVVAGVVVELEARFIAMTSTRGVQFRHDLLRRACYGWMPVEDRIRLHAAMSRLVADPWRRSLHLDGAARRAEAAQTLLAHGLSMIDRADCEEARAAFAGAAKRAFDLPTVEAQARAGLASIVALSGDTERARELMSDVEATSELMPAALRAEMRGRFAEAIFEGSDDTSIPSEFLRLAIDDAKAAATETLPRLYAVAGAVADRSGDARAAERFLTSGVDACTPATPARDRVRLKSWIGVVRARRGDPEKGMIEAEDAAETAASHGLSSEFAQACIKCCYVADLRGDRKAYERWCRRGLEFPGSKLPRVAAHLKLNLATVLKDRGCLDEALTAGEAAFEDSHYGGLTLRVQAGSSLALTYAMLGRFGEAARVIEDLDHADVSDRWRRALTYASGRVAEMHGDLEGALARYRSVAKGWMGLHEPEGTDVRAIAGEARILFALRRYDELFRAWDDLLSGFTRGWPLGTSLRAEIEGYALIAGARVEEGVAALLAAAKSSKERFRAAYLTAAAGLAGADRDLINTAIGELEEMGAHAASEGIRRKAHGIGLRPRHRPRSKRAVTTSDMRIASLIRAGKTNAEIGTQLGLSTKTVEHYVSNMLAKFGLRSRAQLAATIGSDKE